LACNLKAQSLEQLYCLGRIAPYDLQLATGRGGLGDGALARLDDADTMIEPPGSNEIRELRHFYLPWQFSPAKAGVGS
jgi:hypothetical protein